MEEGSTSTDDRHVKKIFRDYMTWRKWILKVLTSDKGSELRLPWEDLPPVLRGVSLGINFARESILSKAWISLEAIKCDDWLVQFATFYSVGLDGNEKQILFDMIREVPKLHDAVTEQLHVRENAIVSSSQGNKAPTGLKRSLEDASKYPAESRKKASKHQSASKNAKEDETLEPAIDVGDDLNVHEECSTCHGECTYQHWIACDTCEKWFHCKCVQITPAEAEIKPHYECHLHHL